MWRCCSETGSAFSIGVGIEVADREQFVEDIVEEDPEQFSEEDYVDAFDWITIDIRCLGCKNGIDRWIDLEMA